MVKFDKTVTIKLNDIKTVKKVSLLGFKERLKWKLNGEELVLQLPASVQKNNLTRYAASFKNRILINPYYPE